MALDKTKHDVNRYTTGIALPETVSAEVIQGITENSAVMQLARNEVIPGTGVSINVITGEPVPEWADETEEQAVKTPTFSKIKMTPHKLSVIVPFSKEFQRDSDALYSAVVSRVPAALAKAFDSTVFGFTASPGADFSQLTNANKVDIQKDTYTALVTAKTGIATAGGNANGFIFAPQASPILLSAVDANKRPLFIDNMNEQGDVSRVLGINALYRHAAYKQGGSAANNIGFVGDWSKAIVGMVKDITVEYADQATINDGTKQINLWQRDMFALKCSMECGFVIEDAKYFTALTDTYSG